MGANPTKFGYPGIDTGSTSPLDEQDLGLAQVEASGPALGEQGLRQDPTSPYLDSSGLQAADEMH